MPKLTPEMLSFTVSNIRDTQEQSKSYMFIRSGSKIFFRNGERATPVDVQALQDQLEFDETIDDSGTLIIDTIITPNILVCGTLLNENMEPDSKKERQATIELVRNLVRLIADQPTNLSVSGME